MILTIEGKPIRKRRARFWRKAKVQGVVNVQRTEEGEYLGQLEKQLTGHKVFAGALRVSILFVMPRPKAHYRTGAFAGKLKESAPIFHTGTPDLDNLEKFILDVLNGLVWGDDRQIIEVWKKKRFGERPRTIIAIEQAEEN